MMRKITIIAAVLLSMLAANAQERIGNVLEIDKTVHNFGDIMLGSGPVSCTFTFKNISEKPVVVYNVVSSCGCTDVKWTKEPLRPGDKGNVSVTYSNDEGPYPFDKTITMYVSDIKKPVLLKVRGVSLAKAQPLEELYPVAYGPLAMKIASLKCGNLDQGEKKSDAVMVANLSDKPICVTFGDVSQWLDLKVSPNPIPAHGTAEMSYTVTASRELWGKNRYWATPQVDGKSYKNGDNDSRICVTAFTRENFSAMSEEEKDKGPMPKFTTSTFQAGKIKKGDTIHAEFEMTNDGKTPFSVYKVDADVKCWSHSDIPVCKPGQKIRFRVHIETSSMHEGEMLAIVTLTTNCPLRPIINLFVAGWIE
ncbi:MAG: DUF1573 domain-containing protein [Bacteroidales bacterium]|nr:DUF1573 domain-containing protein [Bacteroidales bacterium]MBR5862909.1 DUF1573 domain-containing protein [Bacteroidales bacterium]